jgi:hypothetical protein
LKKLKANVTSALESVSEILCLISLAIEKKTSSTFKFVLALCRKYSGYKQKITDKAVMIPV